MNLHRSITLRTGTHGAVYRVTSGGKAGVALTFFNEDGALHEGIERTSTARGKGAGCAGCVKKRRVKNSDGRGYNVQDTHIGEGV